MLQHPNAILALANWGMIVGSKVQIDVSNCQISKGFALKVLGSVMTSASPIHGVRVSECFSCRHKAKLAQKDPQLSKT